jgi:hypothetical protein
MGYIRKHNRSGLKVGDHVTITHIAKGYERGWADNWVEPMDNFVGVKGSIVKDNGDQGFHVLTSKGDWNFPFFVLEKVPDDGLDVIEVVVRTKEKQNLKEMSMRKKFVVDVNGATESRVLQEVALRKGYKWDVEGEDYREVRNTDMPRLFFNSFGDGYITYSRSTSKVYDEQVSFNEALKILDDEGTATPTTTMTPYKTFLKSFAQLLLDFEKELS